MWMKCWKIKSTYLFDMMRLYVDSPILAHVCTTKGREWKSGVEMLQKLNNF